MGSGLSPVYFHPNPMPQHFLKKLVKLFIYVYINFKNQKVLKALLPKTSYSSPPPSQVTGSTPSSVVLCPPVFPHCCFLICLHGDPPSRKGSEASTLLLGPRVPGVLGRRQPGRVALQGGGSRSRVHAAPSCHPRTRAAFPGLSSRVAPSSELVTESSPCGLSEAAASPEVQCQDAAVASCPACLLPLPSHWAGAPAA